ncbi:MAG: class I SAM-dependent methyltransferase [Jatrophihabitans sp.]
MLHPTSDEQIVEIGPGTGLRSLQVARLLRTGELTVVDVRQELLDHVQRRAAQRGVRLRAVRADATSLPLDDATFDAGYLVNVLGEIPNRPALLGELRRVLKPGGRLIVGEFADRHHLPLGKLVRLANGSKLRYVRHTGAPLAYHAEFVA